MTKFGTNSKREESEGASPTQVSGLIKVLLILGVLLGAAAVVVGCLALARGNSDSGSPSNVFASSGSSSSSTSNETAVFSSRLEEIYARGHLNCGYFLFHPGFLFVTGTDETTGISSYAGIDYQLCRVLSAAIFDGDAEAFELVQTSTVNRWADLEAGEIDVFGRTAFTMGRDVFEPAAQTGFHFSSCYLYDPVTFGGIEEHVRCAENYIEQPDAEICEGLKICTWEGTIVYDLMYRLFPPENLVDVPSTSNPFVTFPDGCNVIVGIQSHVTEASFPLFGFDGKAFAGSYAFGVERHSLVTKQNDPVWSDFVETVLQTLIAAEEQGITRTRASGLPTIDIFGPRFERMLQHVIATTGNYGELYVDNVEAFLPRTRLNRPNTGSEPRLLPISFGNLAADGPLLELVSPTVQTIREQGYLTCGHVLRPGLSEFDSVSQTYVGFQVDLCRAVSAAIFDGVDRTLFATATPTNSLSNLNDGQYDLLFSASWSIPNDAGNVNVGTKGVSFAGPFLYLGTGFGGQQPYVDCAERLDVTLRECQDLRVCAVAGSNVTDIFSDFLRDNFVVSTNDFVDMVTALRDGRCNVIFASIFDVQERAVRAAGYGEDLPYTVGTRQFSIEPLAIAMRQDDAVWNDFVRWVFQALIHAEAQGIGQVNATLMPRTNLFGPLRTEMFHHAVNMAGNYGEIYERNLEELLPRSGVHLVNNFSQPLLYSLPGLF